VNIFFVHTVSTMLFKEIKMNASKAENSETNFPGWYRGHNLPHFDNLDAIQHVTFHLSDSLPESELERLEQALLALPADDRDRERRKRLHALIDAGYGSCVLRLPELAKMAEDTLLFFDGEHYHLFAWAVMPNHIHALLQQLDDWTHAQIVASWRKHMGTEICDFFDNSPDLAAAECPRPVWHRDYWDRYIRNEQHFLNAAAYIHNNPVEAGLVKRAEEWRWGSAWEGRAPHRLGLGGNRTR
jgi:type I restriction enzyme R subunit/putative DNA methylase